MKKVLAVILAVIMLTGITSVVHAENPITSTASTFDLTPKLTKFVRFDNFMIVEAQMSGESVFPGPDGNIWVIGENNTDKNDHISLLDKSSGSILKSVEIEGHVSPYNQLPFLRKGNYLYIATRRDNWSTNDVYIGYNWIYCFDLQSGNIVWKISGDRGKVLDYRLTLVPDGIVYHEFTYLTGCNGDQCKTENFYWKASYRAVYVNDRGETVFSYNNSYAFAYSSQNNSIFIARYEDNGKQDVIEVSMKDGKILNTYNLPDVQINGTPFFYFEAIQNENFMIDLSKTNTVGFIMHTNDKLSPYYTTRLLVSDLKFDGSNFTLLDTATYNPDPSDVWYGSKDANADTNYMLVSRVQYRILMDTPFYHVLSQKIELHDEQNTLLWNVTTKTTKTIANFNIPVVFKDMLVYGDNNSIVFADIKNGTPKYTIPIDKSEINSNDNVMLELTPLGVCGNDFYFEICDFSDSANGNFVTFVYKVSFPSGNLTINSNKGSSFTISDGNKSMKVEANNTITLPPGNYTITCNDTIDGWVTPDPVQVAINDGDNKTITMDYKDVTPPNLTFTVSAPYIYAPTSSATFTIDGTVSDNDAVNTLTINGNSVQVVDGKFSYKVTTAIVPNTTFTITIESTDKSGNKTTKTYDYTFTTYSITASAGSGGTITPSGTVTAINGTDQTFTITPNSGYKISDVKVDGKSVGAVSTYTFSNITDNHTIEATFKKNEIVIVLQVGQTTFTVNGSPNTLDSPPIIKNGRTLLPIRPVVEALGGTVGWDGTERKVTVTLGSTTIELWIGKNTARVNGITKPIDSSNPKVVPEIINGRTMLPLRFVTENLGCQLQWDPNTKTITITYQR